MKYFWVLIVFSLLFISFHAMAQDTPEGKTTKAVSIAEEITEMRSTLARNVIKTDTEITEDTFKNVCGAVGKRVKEIADKEGVKIRHAAIKNRNPGNIAAPEEVRRILTLDNNRDMRSIWDTTEYDGKRYRRYIKPIFVEDSCLACHGPKDKRPKFIVDKYPDDKAYDFKTGDLRGIIEVMIPE